MSHVPNLTYAPDLMLDLWLPATQPRALVVWLHGGGFVKGSRTQPFSAKLAARLQPLGVAVAAVDYQLGVTDDAFAPAEADIIRKMQARSRKAGLTLAPRLCGAAMIGALLDAGRAMVALRDGALHPATAGLPQIVAGMSAGGIVALSLAYPPSEYAPQLPRPAAVLTLAATLVQPWRLAPDGPPARMLNGPTDRIIGPENPQLIARRAAALLAPVTLVNTGIAGHNPQLPALLTAHDPAGRPLLAQLTDLIDAAIAKGNADVAQVAP